jgi:hypothetical protein
MEAFQVFIKSTPVFALLILCVVYAIGEFIGTYSKAWVPSVFVVACLFLFGYWTFFPKDIVAIGGLGAPLGGIIAIMLCITPYGHGHKSKGIRCPVESNCGHVAWTDRHDYFLLDLGLGGSS